MSSVPKGTFVTELGETPRKAEGRSPFKASQRSSGQSIASGALWGEGLSVSLGV